MSGGLIAKISGIAEKICIGSHTSLFSPLGVHALLLSLLDDPTLFQNRSLILSGAFLAPLDDEIEITRSIRKN